MIYGVQAFAKRGKQLTAEPPITDADKTTMLCKDERLARAKAGVAVYQVEIDDDIGDVGEPGIIARYGELPAA